MVLLLIGKLILGPGCWNQVHPLVTDIPVDWEYTIPYGLIYAMDPPKELLEFPAVIGEADSGNRRFFCTTLTCREMGLKNWT